MRGVRTRYQPPMGTRSAVVASVTVSIFAAGACDVIKLTLAKLRDRIPCVVATVTAAGLEPGEEPCEVCGRPVRGVTLTATTVQPPDLLQGHHVAFHSDCVTPKVRASGQFKFQNP